MFSKRFRLFFLISLLGAAVPGAADRLVTASGMTVEGTIVSENEHHVMITTQYGELRFQKIHLNQIERGVSTAPTPAPSDLPSASDDPFGLGTGSRPASDPFGAASPSAAPAADPFGGAAANPFGGPPPAARSAGVAQPANPFGDAAANPFGAPPAPATASPNPFGGPAPDSASANPFGAPPPATPAVDPFAGEASNPFGGAPAANPLGATAAPPAAPSPNPFGGNPFGGAPQVSQAASPAPADPPAEIRQASLSVPKPKRAPDVSNPPQVRSGFAAVVYGLNTDYPIKVKSAAQQEWATATEDQHLQIGSRVYTEGTRTSRMLLRGKSDEIRLPNESEVEVRHLSDDSEEVTLFLHRGSVWSEVSPRSRPDSFKIQTPELTAGVRGTRFIVERSGGFSTVSVQTGEVHVTANNSGAFVTVRPNQSAVVNAAGQIMDLVATPVDHEKIWNEWEEWSTGTAGGTGTLAGAGAVGGLTQQIASDNAAWQATMEEGNRLIAQNRYMDKLQEYAGAFEKFASDTGVIPEDADGWSILRFNTGIAGWNGPYIEGAIPPADPWGRPLNYRKLRSRAGNVIGRVYSVGSDGIDQQGENSSTDMVAIIMYFRLDRFANDPDVAPPQ